MEIYWIIKQKKHFFAPFDVLKELTGKEVKIILINS